LEESNHYLNDATADGDVYPLDWWKLYIGRYPKLAQVAKAFLAIPATSAASERVFSKARLAMPWYRCRLASSTLRAIMCLRDSLEVNDPTFEEQIAEELENMDIT
jgi:hypothetical protein